MTILSGIKQLPNQIRVRRVNNQSLPMRVYFSWDNSLSKTVLYDIVIANGTFLHRSN